VFDRLFRDRDRLNEKAPVGEFGRDSDKELRRAGEVFGHIAVRADDAALVVLAVRGHIRLAAVEILVAPVGSAADSWDDHVALREIGAVCIFDDADSFVAQHHMVGVGRIAAVAAADDLVVGTVDADPERPHQRLAWVRIGPWQFDEFGL